VTLQPVCLADYLGNTVQSYRSLGNYVVLLNIICHQLNISIHSSSLFGAKKSSAGTAAAVIVGYAASYVFWSRYAARGDEGDCSWLMARQMSNWKGPINTQPTPFPRLPNPNSSMSLQTLSLLNGCAAGLAEVSYSFPPLFPPHPSFFLFYFF
jgi:hypothetical protein